MKNNIKAIIDADMFTELMECQQNCAESLKIFMANIPMKIRTQISKEDILRMVNDMTANVAATTRIYETIKFMEMEIND